MRGTILGFDAGSGEGVISGEGGNRIKFKRADWKSPGDPTPGRQVDFAFENERATDIFVVPGTGNPLDIGNQEPARQATTYGIISLVCGIVTFFLGPIGIVTVVLAVVFGIKGKNIGMNLPDKTGYYLSVGGLVLAGIALLITLVALTACAGLVGLMGSLGAFH